jgi:hypothetical protein
MVGHETTGGSLVFILWELARQPAVQVIKIVSHLSLIIDDMFRTGFERKFCRMGATCLTMISKNSNFWTQWLKKGEFTLNYKFNLDYKLTVCSLRLHPASPQTERLALQDDSIPLSNSLPGIGTTFRVKRGQVCTCSSPNTVKLSFDPELSHVLGYPHPLHADAYQPRSMGFLGGGLRPHALAKTSRPSVSPPWLERPSDVL